MSKTRIGVIGCGMISDTYFNAAKRFGNIEIAACADIDMEVAKKKAEAHENLFPAKTVDELLADPSIELVINLTVPKAHAEVDMQILRAGKHAYSEKPLGVDLDQAREVMKLAAEKNLRIGCAPDTFLGGGQQTARKLIDDGWIGKPIAGTAMVLGRGPEKWAHAPFFYDYGAGPMLDLGPYYMTALVNLLGPAKSVIARTTKGFDYRTLGAEVSETYQGIYKPAPALGELLDSLLESGEAPLNDRIPMVMADGAMYYDTGRESTVTGRCGVMDGEITSAVERTEVPSENNQSNFGAGYGYQWGPEEGTLEVCMDGKWVVFERRYADDSRVYFAGRWYDKSGLSEDTLRWLAWYNGLSEEEQACISAVPADLLDESGISRTEETDAQAD